MPTVEIRLTTPARLDEALALPIEAIGLGQEGCLAKMPCTADLRAAANRIRAARRSVVLIAPIAWPRTFDTVLERLEAVTADGPTTVAVNDVGTLLALAASPRPDRTLIAGLGLTRARPHTNSTTPITSTPVVDAALLEICHRYGVVGAEIDTDTAIDDDIGDRWQLRQLVDAIPLAYGRSCPTARHHRTGPPDCQTLCDISYTITPYQRWQLTHGHREPLPAGTHPRTLTVWGNAVYRSADTSPTAAYRIIDARWHSQQQLADAVSAVRADQGVLAAER
jgi:hypothetical protein